MTQYDTAAPYIAAFVVLRENNKIAFVLRANTGWMDGKYGLPAGKVEKNETFTHAAVREAREEAGVTIAEANLRHVLTSHRAGDTPQENQWVDIIFEATTWQGEPYNAEPEVHSELTWLDPDNLPENMIPSVRIYMEKIRSGETYVQPGWDY